MNESTRILFKSFMLIFNILMVLMGMQLTHAIEINGICPRMLHRVFNGYAPIGNHFLRKTKKKNRNSIIIFIQATKRLAHIVNFSRQRVLSHVWFNAAWKRPIVMLHSF